MKRLFSLIFTLILLFSCNQTLTNEYIKSRNWKHAGGPRFAESDIISFDMLVLQNDTIFVHNNPYALLVSSKKYFNDIKNEEIEVKLFSDSISSKYCDFGPISN